MPELYTIHVLHFGAVIPVLYALLPSKTAQTYRRLFDVLKSRQPQINPKLWMTDFEQAAITAIREYFPEVQSTGCFFHLQQCVWRRVQHLGLVGAYEEHDGRFAMSVRCLAALAFVPEMM